MTEAQITISTHERLSAIGEEAWDACACPEAIDGRPNDPFTTYRFLSALEQSGSVGVGTGWQPLYLTAELDGEIIGCAPVFGKNHSQGEYIFDHNWAHAYERAGGRYYPKLQLSVPFTPVTGRRFLVKPGFEEIAAPALIQGCVQVADQNNLSSLHVTFCTEEESEVGDAMGLFRRSSQQFHWENRDYSSFDDFLAHLSSRKRKNIRKERAKAQEFGGDIRMLTGSSIEAHHWDAVWEFYQDTGARKWGTPYLTRKFFEIAHETMRDDILLILAERSGRPVAGALNWIGAQALYGRYWGCIEEHPCLHFELCYYKAIDFAIEHRLKTVEAGAQGEHKLARGYMPVTTHSLHWIRDPGFANAIGEYLEAERRAIDQDIEILTSYGPFRRNQEEDHQ